MSAALGLLLIGQLNSFEFSPIASPQYAGDSFDITIVAKDPYGGVYPYNGPALLSTNRDDYWSYVWPQLITFVQGIWQGPVMVSLAESLRLKCTEPANNISGVSNWFDVMSGAPARFLVILPGESLAPGSPRGRLPRQPASQIAGQQFDLDVFLTDGWFNPVEFRNDSVYFSSTDSFAALPAGGALSNGSGRFPVAVRQAGTQRLIARPSAQQAFTPDSSTEFSVSPGPFEQLLLVLPGEALLPGDNATSPWQTPGKSGEPAVQFVHELFAAVIYACDGCWNRVTAPSLEVALHSDFQMATTPSETLMVDSATFSTEFGTPGPNQNIWVTGQPGDYISYRSQIDVRARGQRLEVTKPDTVRAGETTAIRVVVRDANDDPIGSAVCQFTVVKGNGDMLDEGLRQRQNVAFLTDTLGIVNARFLCTRARFAEHDTILISSGNAETLVGIFVSIPDSMVMKGEIIAFPNPFGGVRDAAEIYYYLNQSSPITVAIYDPFGNEVQSWRFQQNQPGARSGLNRIVWDGRNRRGRRVASGIYVIQIVGELHTGTTYNRSYRIGVAW